VPRWVDRLLAVCATMRWKVDLQCGLTSIACIIDTDDREILIFRTRAGGGPTPAGYPRITRKR
jgi:hypothetical protein